MKAVTRKQLMGMGATKYQTKLITKTLQPVRKQERAYVYDLLAVSGHAWELIENDRLRKPTRDAIRALRWELLAFAETIQDAPFGMTVLEQIKYAEHLDHQSKTLFAAAQAQEHQIKQKRKVVTLECRKYV